METLERALLRLEPKIDLIHECLGMGRFADLTYTSDGFFLGRTRGDCGFNAFLGVPSESARQRTKRLFERLSPAHQQEVIRRLEFRRIPLAAVGIANRERERANRDGR